MSVYKLDFIGSNIGKNWLEEMNVVLEMRKMEG